MSTPSNGPIPPGPGNIPPPPGGTPPTTPPAPSGNGTGNSALRRRVTAANPNDGPSVQNSPTGNEPVPTPIQSRTSDTPNPPQPTTQPAPPQVDPQVAALQKSFDQVQNNLKDTMAELWLRDQVSITQDLLQRSQDPNKADSVETMTSTLQIKIKVLYPGETNPVQVFPDTKEMNPAERQRYTEYLQQATQKLHTHLDKEAPQEALFHRYVDYRKKVFEFGREIASQKGELFDWQPLYNQLLHSSFDKQLSVKNTDYSFSRGEPDPSKAVDQSPLNELEIQEQKEAQDEAQDEAELKKQKKPKKKPKKKPHLKQPQMEFRIDASPEDIHRHSQLIDATEQRAIEHQRQQHGGNPPPPINNPA